MCSVSIHIVCKCIFELSFHNLPDIVPKWNSFAPIADLLEPFQCSVGPCCHFTLQQAKEECCSLYWVMYHCCIMVHKQVSVKCKQKPLHIRMVTFEGFGCGAFELNRFYAMCVVIIDISSWGRRLGVARQWKCGSSSSSIEISSCSEDTRSLWSQRVLRRRSGYVTSPGSLGGKSGQQGWRCIGCCDTMCIGGLSKVYEFGVIFRMMDN